MDACKACSRNLARSDRSILCSGSCGRVFHPGCVGLNATNFKAWAANVGLLWFCENCRVNFNPSIMDREAVIMKTMRDLLLRVDSMDLRVGQFGENLKILNSLLSLSTSIRRDSNFSSRLQQFAMSATPAHDPTEFYNSIDRFNLDLSLRSNAANNTIADIDDDHDEPLDNDDAHIDREGNQSQRQPEVVLFSTESNTTVSTSPAIPAANATSATVPTTTATTTTPAFSGAAAAVIHDNGSTAAITADTATASTSYAAIASRPAVAAAVAVSKRVQPAGITVPRAAARVTAANSLPTRSTIVAGSTSNDAMQSCRLKVVNRIRSTAHQTSKDEPLKSFYITPFHIEQSEEDVIEYLRETINIENSTVKCVKLVPRNKSIHDLSFVSFKLSVSDNLVSVINDPFYWPEGVEIREFQSKNGNPPNQIMST